MPYTPPSQHSPAASTTPTPTISRSQSFFSPKQYPEPAPVQRPVFSRSNSSTSYLHRHRRSPSAVQQEAPDNAPATPDATPVDEEIDDAPAATYSKHISRSSLRQSPPPVNDLVIPSGAIISPPDSGQNSSDDEDLRKGSSRGRGLQLDNLAELQAAIRIIEQHRESSPNRLAEEKKKARIAVGLDAPPALPASISVTPASNASTPTPQQTTRPPLSAEARRISHSRSATEASVVYIDAPHQDMQDAESPQSATSDSDDSDVITMHRKPPMVRKKSGELVTPCLRPASARRRPSSMPGTPTFSKAVHFDSHLEHVRHFLQVDRPLAVSAGSSPVESYENDGEFPFGNERGHEPPWKWEINLSNFPRESHDRLNMPVRVERVFLSADNKHLIGSVAVQNLAFSKTVVARFTLDYWKTTSEVVAEFNNDVRRTQNDGLDRFNFDIRLEDQANLENKTLFFCVRYNVNGQELWDSNNGINYQVDFSKKPVPINGKQGLQQQKQAKVLSSLPRSNSMSPGGRPRPKSATFGDLPDTFDSQYDFGSFPQPAAVKLTGDSPIRFKNQRSAPKFVPETPTKKNNAQSQAFGNRYDFGASLSAAIQAASTTLGERSGLMPLKPDTTSNAKQSDGSAKAQGQVPKIVTSMGNQSSASAAQKTANAPKPTALTAEKPPLQSQSYHELLDKYCFYGSSKPTNPADESSSKSSNQPGNGAFDGSDDNTLSSSSSSSSHSSGSSSPSIARSPAEQLKHYVSRGRSPSPAYDSRTASPVSFGYPYHQSNGFFADAHTPTAIRG